MIAFASIKVHCTLHRRAKVPTSSYFQAEKHLVKVQFCDDRLSGLRVNIRSAFGWTRSPCSWSMASYDAVEDDLTGFLNQGTVFSECSLSVFSSMSQKTSNPELPKSFQGIWVTTYIGQDSTTPSIILFAFEVHCKYNGLMHSRIFPR